MKQHRIPAAITLALLAAGGISLLYQPTPTVLASRVIPVVRFAPRAQATSDPYLDALATQSALGAQATQQAFAGSGAGSSADAAANAAAARAAAAQAEAWAANQNAIAVRQAQQATSEAVKQQLAQAQATSDAAAMRATAIVQQTRTALELSAQATRQFNDAVATRQSNEAQNNRMQATKQAVYNQATKQALSAQATQQAVDSEFVASAQTAAEKQKREQVGSWAIALIAVALVVIAATFAARSVLSLARSVRTSRPLSFGSSTGASGDVSAAPFTVPAYASEASEMTYDQGTGHVERGLAVIERDSDPDHLSDWQAVLHGK
jgi:hypothetical protein